MTINKTEVRVHVSLTDKLSMYFWWLLHYIDQQACGLCHVVGHIP